MTREQDIKRLIDLGRERGYLTYDLAGTYFESDPPFDDKRQYTAGKSVRAASRW